MEATVDDTTEIAREGPWKPNIIVLFALHGEPTLFYANHSHAYKHHCYEGNANLKDFVDPRDFVSKPGYGSVHLIGEGGAIHAAPPPGDGRLLFSVNNMSPVKLNQIDEQLSTLESSHLNTCTGEAADVASHMSCDLL